MIVPKASKIPIVAVTTALVASACGAAGEPLAVSRSDAASSSHEQVSPLAGSNVQDMQDLYALKRQVAALRRTRAASGGGCNVGSG